MSKEAVQAVVIGPMLERYSPPERVRREPGGVERALERYVELLSPFDAATLQRAWDRAEAENQTWCWPPVGRIAEACRALAPRTQGKSEGAQLREQAEAMADQYASRYMKTTHLAKLAKREGWAGYLREYVHAAASVQAQLMLGVKGIAWGSGALRERGSHVSGQEALDAYRKRVKGAVERGQIRVVPPPSRVREWKERCRQRGESPAEGR